MTLGDENGRQQMPRFGHFQDAERWKANVAAGADLCERCDGCGNELYAMWHACSDCGGTGVKPAPSPPIAVSEPVPLPPLPMPCVAPSWPEWACDEDGEIVWVRADLTDRAADLAAPALDWVDDEYKLVAQTVDVMWWDRRSTLMGDWWLHPVNPEDDPHDVAAYVVYEVEIA